MYYSTLSGNQSLLKLFITSTNCHETEEVWVRAFGITMREH